MIQLIIAFLISIGWLTTSTKQTIEVDNQGNNRYGVVSTDDVGTRNINVLYNEQSGVFSIE